MKQNAFCNFLLAGVSLTDFGLEIPSPFVSLELSNSEVTSMTSWRLTCVVGGDASRNVNISAFEALLYSGAQAASSYPNASGIPVSFIFGWLRPDGSVDQYLSYQGFTLQFEVSTSGLFMEYNIKGFASLAVQSSAPVLHIPPVCGVVQPSAILEALAIGVRATDYYDLDIDHNDAPTLVNHGAMTTSFNQYVRGTYDGKDEYSEFPGLIKLSKSYNGTREADGLSPYVHKLSQVLNNATVTPVASFLKKSITDLTPQCSSFSYWVDEPTMTRPGIIHYKSNAGMSANHMADVLEYGTANTNILTLSGSYNGVAYNISDMRFDQVGFTVDGSGNSIAQPGELVRSWSSSLADVFQRVNIVNDINAIATQFSGDFTVQLAGEPKAYTIAQPVSLLVMSGNTVSPISGIYNIMSVSHTVNNKFITTLKLRRLVMGSANEVASRQGIFVSGTAKYPSSAYTTTKNIISPYKVDFGDMYPNFTHMTFT